MNAGSRAGEENVKRIMGVRDGVFGWKNGFREGCQNCSGGSL